MRRYLLVAVASLLVCDVAFSHPGRTDANGGHHNRKTGGYHYHGGGRSVTPTVPFVPRTRPRTRATIAPRTRARSAVESPDRESVYVNEVDKKYHAFGCRHLRRKRVPIDLADAAARYSPCRVCRPPKLATEQETDRAESGSSGRRPKNAITNPFDKIVTPDQQAVTATEQVQEAETPDEENEDKALREKHAAEKLRLAMRLLKRDRSAAIRWLNDVVEQYPGSDAAEQAAATLERLQ